MTKEDIPQVLKDAVVAAEDRKFWTHKGIDPEGLVRAAITNYREGDDRAGRLDHHPAVRQEHVPDQRAVGRAQAQRGRAGHPLERDLTDELGSQRAAKEEILYRYLNTVVLRRRGLRRGGRGPVLLPQGRQGPHAVARPPRSPAIIPSPTTFAPRDNLFVAEERRIDVLGEMRDAGDDQRRRVRRRQGALPLADRGWATPASRRRRSWRPAGQRRRAVPVLRRLRAAATCRAAYGQDGRSTAAACTSRPRSTPGCSVWPTPPVTVRVGKYRTRPSTCRWCRSTRRPAGAGPWSAGRDFASSQVNLALGGSTGMQPGSSMKTVHDGRGARAGHHRPTRCPRGQLLADPRLRRHKDRVLPHRRRAGATMGPAIDRTRATRTSPSWPTTSAPTTSPRWPTASA